MKVSTFEKHEEVALEVLKKKKRPVRAKVVHKEILENYDVKRIRPSPNKLAKRLNKNPNVRVIKKRGGALYELL